MALHHCVGNTISIRAPTRGATSYASRSLWECAFQSALPRGERPRYPSARSFPGVISIRAPARGATQYGRILSVAQGFQSALPRGERQDHILLVPDHSIFQSALPRGERHCIDLRQVLFGEISIRAPARGATVLSDKPFIIFISIRAPARGATRCTACPTYAKRFQSALPRGERHCFRKALKT